MFTEILNSFLNVRNKVKDVNGNWVDETIEEEKQHMSNGFQVSASEEIVVFSTWGKKVIIDLIEYSVSDEGVYPKITVAEGSENGNYSDQLLHNINPGSGRGFPHIDDIQNDGSRFLEAIGTSKAILKHPIVLPDGCQLSFSTSSSEPTGTVTYKVYWREIG